MKRGSQNQIIQKRVQLIGTEAFIRSAFLILLCVSLQISLTCCFSLFSVRFLLAEGIMLHDIIQITDNRGMPNCLGVVTGNNAGDLFAPLVCILMIQEELVLFAVCNDPPLAPWRMDVQLAILQVAGNSIFLTEPINGVLLFPKFHTNRGTATTKPIACVPSDFGGCKLLPVLLQYSAADFAVRKVEYFLPAFFAVEYHEAHLLVL